MKKVYICASFGSGPTESLAKAEWYTEYALRCGAAPIVPHFYGLNQKKAYTGTCAAAGRSLLWLCDEVWVFGDTVTDGMRAELKFCKNLNIRIRYITEKEIQNVIGGKTL